MLKLSKLTWQPPEGGQIIKGMDLAIPDGKLVVLTGPNGGKTTLAKLIAGLETPTSGQIFLDGKDITPLDVTQRARCGVSYAFQTPVRFKGLTVRDLVELAAGGALSEATLCELLGKVGLCAREYMDREINASLSGGEIKRSELLQLMAQQPNLLLFDEPESGVDLENMALVGKTVRKLLDGVPDCCSATLREQGRQRSTSGLIITHTGHILEYVNADRGQVMYHGKLCCEARPRVILDHIAQHGYQECLRCLAGDMYGKIAEAPLV